MKNISIRTHVKNILAGLLLALMFGLVSAPAVHAADIGLVYDETGLLTDEEYAELSETAIAITESYDCEVAVAVVRDMSDDGFDDAFEYAEWFYEAYGYGAGPAESGLLFVLSMAERDYGLVAYGYGNTAFTDYGKDVLLDQYVLPRLAEDGYYEGFAAYFSKADEYLSMAVAGEPFDIEESDDNFIYKLGATVIIPIVIALGICLAWRRQMKTAVAARAADNYIPSGGFNLTRSEDHFVRRSVSRRRIEQSSSGGGGTSVNSRGFSGRGGKF